MWCASRRPPLGVRLFLSHFAVSLRFSLQPSCHLAVSPFSSCSPLSLLPLSRRSPLPRSATPPPPVPCSRGFFRLSAQLRPPCCISWPLESIELSSRKDESSHAHCDHLREREIICHPVMSLLRSTLSSNTCAFTDDAGAGVPFGCIVTADNWISTGSSSSLALAVCRAISFGRERGVAFSAWFSASPTGGACRSPQSRTWCGKCARRAAS